MMSEIFWGDILVAVPTYNGYDRGDEMCGGKDGTHDASP